jgi:hypothetical protein
MFAGLASLRASDTVPAPTAIHNVLDLCFVHENLSMSTRHHFSTETFAASSFNLFSNLNMPFLPASGIGAM